MWRQFDGFLIKPLAFHVRAAHDGNITVCLSQDWIRQHHQVEIPFVGAILQLRLRRWWSGGALGLVRNPRRNRRNCSCSLGNTGALAGALGEDTLLACTDRYALTANRCIVHV